MNKQLLNFVEKLLSYQPHERITILDVYDEPWMQKYGAEQLRTNVKNLVSDDYYPAYNDRS